MALDLVLLGPPGSGKGTQAARLTEKYRIPAIATGDILRDRLSDPDPDAGFILDGFPRTVPQAQALDAMLAELQRPLDAVLYLETDRQSLLDRLGHRHRQDDRPEIADHRIDVFHEQTEPLIDYYRANGKLRLVDGARPPEMVAAALDDLIRPLAAAGGEP